MFPRTFRRTGAAEKPTGNSTLHPPRNAPPGTVGRIGRSPYRTALPSSYLPRPIIDTTTASMISPIAA